ncbi:MAG: RNA polymerase sigma factor [Candidatus Kerfeldbacteria bacterium]|nr:RNA polymerase sigma factor [Candidatus Kerfeldbacteria bacterium]
MAGQRSCVLMSDEDLMLCIQQGYDPAFTELVSRYRGKMMATAMKILHHEDQAEDAVQSAFIKIYHSRMGFRHESTLSTWIYTIVTNEALMGLRRRRITHVSINTGTDAGTPLSDSLVSPEIDPAVVYEREVLRRLIIEAVERLDPKAREVFILRHVYEKNSRDMSAELGIGIGAVKSRLHRARAEVGKYIRRSRRPNRGGSS